MSRSPDNSPPEPTPPPLEAQPPGADAPEPYRETTWATMILGIPLGIVLTAAMTYAGLVIGFVPGASPIFAVIGWMVLRGMIKRGTIVENNILQTVASSINNTASGVIFTFPALMLMSDPEYNVYAIALAATAGGVLGTLFIIPLRRQMIDLERLPFPGGIAVAQVLRSPGAGLRNGLLLLGATAVAMVVGMLVQFELIPHLDPGPWLGVPGYIPTSWAVSLIALGGGYLAGRPGLVVLAGGILGNWIIAPLVVARGWLGELDVEAGASTEQVHAAMSELITSDILRDLGIGMLAGGALAGVLLALPMIKAAFAGVRRAGGGSHELSANWMLLGTAASLVLLFVAALFGDPEVGVGREAGTAIVGTLWMWLAGIIVAQCSGLTGWSPISGLALLAVAIAMLMTAGSVGLGVLIGAAVCVAIGQGSDMMSDLKSGHLVGSRPVRQQITQLMVSWMGPGIAVVTVILIWNQMGFGEANEAIPAAQATTLKEMMEAIAGGEDQPMDKYLVGGLVGGLTTLALGGGFGVLVGLSMYLPIFYVLPFGLGCVLAMVVQRLKGVQWSQSWGVPIAAGFLVGDALAGVSFACYAMLTAGGG